MSRRIPVEWIGVRSFQEDDRISHRKIIGAYTDLELDTLLAIEDVVNPLIRVDGGTARALGPADGFSERIQWGPRRGTYVQMMLEVDVHRMFYATDHHPDQLEFRNLEDPAHADRVPVVPQRFITRVLAKMLNEAHHGPGVVKTSERGFTSNRAVIGALKERDAEMHERRNHRKVY